MVVFLLQMCVVQAALWTGLITNNQWIDYPALKLSWRQKNSNFFSFPLLGYLPHSENIHKICLIDSEKVCTYGDIIISLRVPTDQHCTVQNVGRSILWNKIKISHICKFVSWRLTRHSHVRFIARVQEQSADRLHYHSSIEKSWAPPYGWLLLLHGATQRWAMSDLMQAQWSHVLQNLGASTSC